MKIALVGGTGDIGSGFALRWGQRHEIIIGSRKEDKAQESAAHVREVLRGGNVIGTRQTIRSEGSHSGKVVVSPVVPMSTMESTSP